MVVGCNFLLRTPIAINGFVPIINPSSSGLTSHSIATSRSISTPIGSSSLSGSGIMMLYLGGLSFHLGREIVRFDGIPKCYEKLSHRSKLPNRGDDDTRIDPIFERLGWLESKGLAYLFS